jgi:hypothetical protein
MATIDEASTHLETFITERDNLKVLEDCISSLQQIRGSLDIIQLHGASDLAAEILSTATQIDTHHPDKLDDKLSALTKGFFVLRCYFEYTQQHEVGMPVLLIPYINDIRLVNRKALMPESYFEQADLSYRRPKTSEVQLPDNDELKRMIRRFRHMYQVGLLGVIKEVNVGQSLSLMQRAVGKTFKLSQGRASETLWWLAMHSLTAFISSGINATTTRKRLFALLDKQLKDLEKEGVERFASFSPEELLRELAYYIAIAEIEDPEIAKIKHLYGFENIGYNHQVLQQESISLTGPSANTVQSVADVLRLEFNIVKENIERTQNTETFMDDEYEDTINRMQKVKEILSVVGLTSAANVISKPLEKLNIAHKNHEALSEGDNIDMVDGFLYVESVINSLVKRNFSNEKLIEINRLTQTEMISSSHLQDAQLIVINETENGLANIKKALTAFADSSYDTTHLKDMSSSLDEVRGGMIVLNLPRAAAIMTSCTAFVEKTLMATHEIAALEHMLETFADALICLEYYLDCMKVDKKISPDTLIIAEESLAALGYSVK